MPVQDLTAGVQLGASLYHLSHLASAVLLCPGFIVYESPRDPYYIVFTVEGHEHDVEAELQAMCSMADGVEVEAPLGVNLWKSALHAAGSHLRVGIPPARLSDFMQRHPAAFAGDFIADLANGTIHFSPAPLDQAPALRTTALALAGYAVVVNGPMNMDLDPWGYVPDTLPLMRQLKARWDPNGVLNPGTFLV